MKSLKNISVAEFRKILEILGCRFARNKGGHEAWKKEGLTRPIIFQTHVSPEPEMVVKNAIRDLGITREDFLDAYDKI